MQDQGRAPLTSAEPHDAPAAAPSAGRWRLYAVLGVVAGVSLALDQATKVWALGHLRPGRPQNLIGSGIRLDLIRNPGAAFSIGTGATWLLAVIGVAVLGWVAATVRRLGSRGWAVALGLLVGGSLGNLIDRFFREPGPGRGHVVDFIDYFGLFIGNVADIAIVAAALLIAVLALRGITIAGERVGGGRHTERPVGGERPDDPSVRDE